MKEKGICESHLKKKDKENQKEGKRTLQRRIVFFFKFFLLFVSFSDLWKFDRRNLSGQERKVLYATRATRGYQKHGIFTENSSKNSENPNFWFFSNLQRSNSQNFSDQELKLLYATRATRGYRNHGISLDFHVK